MPEEKHKIDPASVPTYIEMRKPGKEDKARLRNFAQAALVLGNEVRPPIYCHVSELMPANIQKLRQRLTKLVPEFVYEPSADDVKDVVDAIIDSMFDDVKINSHEFGAVVRKLGSNDILGIELNPAVKAAEEDVRNALNRVRDKAAFLFELEADRIPPLMITEYHDFLQVLPPGHDFGTARGITFKYDEDRASHSADMIFLSVGSVFPSTVEKKHKAVASYMFDGNFGMRLTHELTHHFGLDEQLKTIPGFQEALTADIRPLQETVNVEASRCISESKGRQVPVNEMLGYMKRAGLVGEDGQLAQYPQLYKQAVNLTFHEARNELKISREVFQDELKKIQHGGSSTHEAAVSRTLKAILRSSHAILRTAFDNYQNVSHPGYAAMGLDAMDELAPYLFSLQGVYGGDCVKELFPRSMELIQQYVQSQHGLDINMKPVVTPLRR